MDPLHLVLPKMAYPERCSFHLQDRLHILQAVLLFIFYAPASPARIRNLGIRYFPLHRSTVSAQRN